MFIKSDPQEWIRNLEAYIDFFGLNNLANMFPHSNLNAVQINLLHNDQYLVGFTPSIKTIKFHCAHRCKFKQIFMMPLYLEVVYLNSGT
jgi:hypothetical protein